MHWVHRILLGCKWTYTRGIPLAYTMLSDVLPGTIGLQSPVHVAVTWPPSMLLPSHVGYWYYCCCCCLSRACCTLLMSCQTDSDRSFTLRSRLLGTAAAKAVGGRPASLYAPITSTTSEPYIPDRKTVRWAPNGGCSAVQCSAVQFSAVQQAGIGMKKIAKV